MLREWNDKNTGCKLKLEKSLADFFKAKFPDIQLAEEIDKIEAIERLEESGSFAATHKAISTLDDYDDFKDSEVKRILKSYLDNNQIRRILEDEDVREFALKVVGLAKSEETIGLSKSLKELLEQLSDENQLLIASLIVALDVEAGLPAGIAPHFLIWSSCRYSNILYLYFKTDR